VYLLANPPLGQSVQRHRDELKLMTAPEVSSSVERYLGRDRPTSVSKAALEVLRITAYRQPITQPASSSSAAPPRTAPSTRRCNVAWWSTISTTCW
jgi:Segregation and condensation complex subunit ScpB